MARALVLAVLALCLASAVAEQCPLRSTYNGCLKNGCLSLASTGRRTGLQVCDQCGKGYELVNKGTRLAKCQCAPGYAGKGNQGICKACPEGTQIALGGLIIRAACLNCPEGTILSDDATTCLCPAGTYHTEGPSVRGFLGVSCKTCREYNQFMDKEAHAEAACKVCPSTLVSNKDHTACVNAEAPDALKAPAPQPNLFNLGGGNQRNTAAGGAAGARNPLAGIQQGMQQAQQGLQQALSSVTQRASEVAAEQMAMADEGVLPGPLNFIAQRMQNRGARTDAAAAGSGSISAATAPAAAAPAAAVLAAAPVEDAAAPAAAAAAPEPPKKFDLGSMIKKISNLKNVFDPATLMGANKLDPRALADAGLPADTTSGNILSNVMSSTIGDLDVTDWNTGI